MTQRVATYLLLLGLLPGCAANSAPPAADGGTTAADGGDGAQTALDCPDSIVTGTLPDDVFCTGLYESRDPQRHAASALPYTPGVTFWSDGAEKSRYLQLPADSQIDTADLDAWKFPVGTKAWKEFRIDGALVETRIFWKTGDATWASGTYIWTADGRSAALNTSRQPVLLANGYEIPTAKDCGKCHHGASDYLLGVEAVELGLPTAVGVTIASLTAAGSLSDPPAQSTVTLPEDDTGRAGAALGYLHANCGMPCHSSRGLGHETELLLRLRADELWASTAPAAAVSGTEIYQATVRRNPTTASVAQKFPGAQRIIPGSHEQSLVWQLAHTRGQYQMPPLVSHAVDQAGTDRLASWIDALPTQ